jgi:hypothetical protein
MQHVFSLDSSEKYHMLLSSYIPVEDIFEIKLFYKGITKEALHSYFN